MANFPRANKKLGQHFLHDKNIVSKICELPSQEIKSIIEVGPGPGVLTKTLVDYNLPIKVIEKDTSILSYLNENVPELAAKGEIINQDALDIDWSNFHQVQNLTPPTWLVSNLPYNVGVPLLRKFIENQNIKLMTLMLQKEVAIKIVDAAEMGSLHALINPYFETSFLLKVPPECFTPPPKVVSWVIQLRKKAAPLISFEQLNSYEKFIRHLFAQRRKQLGPKLKKSLGSVISTQYIDSAFQQTYISPQDRCENLSLEQVIALFKAFTEQGDFFAKI